ncbi:ankyrin repeat domain-containing protein [Leptospira perdikensis]|uniref:Ankyrin repeat domain-containing protein n=1 Tax=Leptospira perdikensis TaxID=2484948 RepID=A0A4R9JHM1_9LEPT|nr:ankyrin repeat domain-containing protein [Leptospira perdikensis]TGL40829.1 ankyrin repeat domain-containing protein [Leptospira perdikensis]
MDRKQEESGSQSAAWKEFQATIQGEAPEKVTAFRFARAGDLASLSKETPFPEAFEWKDERGNSLLMLSSYHGQEVVTNYLLEKGAYPNDRDRSGNSVLMGAAFKGHLEIVRLLLRWGADPELRNPQGFSALDFATMFGREKIISYLRRITVHSQRKTWKLWIKYLHTLAKNKFLINKKEAHI